MGLCHQGGNIIVTDQDLKILALLRIVHEGQGQEPQKIGLKYAIEQRQNYAGVPPLTKERVKEALKVAIEKAATAQVKKPKPGAALRKGLATTITEVPPVLADHVLQANGFDTTASLEDILASDEKVDLLFKALQQGREIADETASGEKRTGYIIAKTRSGVGPKEDGSSYKREELLYEDYHPFLPQKFADNADYEILTYDNYNKTVDEFHSSIESQKLESKVHEREETAKRKLNAARQDQEKRIEGLQEAQLLNIRKAAAIETNVEWVQEAMNAVNGLLESGMDWVDVGKLVEREQKRNNPVAQMIKLPLKLAENTITLLLNEEEEEEEDDGYSTQSVSDSEDEDEAEEAARQKAPKLSVDINLGITPWANATSYHDQRRTAAEKEKKTAQQSEKAMKSAEQKVKLDLKKGLKQEKPLMQPLRQQMWFDKFHWFISSDGYLVIAGKDAVQHEMLYTRHLRKGDIFCHADVEGAAPAIIKNSPSTADAPIPPSTLSQAGILSVSTSTAWESKAVMAAWWVKAEQVSKTLPGGQILSPGSFTIKGEKNFLPPSPLLVGFAVLFRVSQESREKHSKHRIYESVPEDAEEGEDDAALAAEAAEREENASMDASDDEKIEKMDEKAEDESDAGETEDEDRQTRQRENPLQSGDVQNNEGTEEGAETKAMADLSLAEETAEAPKEQEESAAATESTPNDTSEPQNSAPSSRPGSTAPSQKKQQQQPKRGQRAKAKKIAAKYRHQDEEDRAAIEALIGATAGRQRAEEAAKEKARREAEAEAQRERRRAQHAKQQERAAEHEARRRKIIEEGLDEPLEKERLGIVEELVGTPLPGDEILEAIPICAPWAALGKVKYRVKLQPGSIKRGKAVKEILERWKAESERKGVVDPRGEDAEKMWPREVELVKGLRPEEAVGVVPVGRVTVMMSGGKAKGKGQQGKGGKKKK